ncbi:hypothetical protein ACFFRR_003156 [Megaselia abdita]
MCDEHVQMCYHCYRLNFTTMNCICKMRSGFRMYDHPQTLRFVGSPVARPFIDVTIMKKTIPGMIDTSSKKSSIDETLARVILNLDMFQRDEDVIPAEVRVPIDIGDTRLPLTCSVKPMEPSVHLLLAMDFLYFHPIELSINNVTINTQTYWNTLHHEDLEFVYNHRRGRILRRKLDDIGWDNFQTKSQRKF